MAARFAGFRLAEKLAIAFSLLVASFLLIDPLILGVVRELDPSVRQFFRRFTDLGKSSWILLSAALLFIVLAALRTRDIGARAAAAYATMAQVVAFVFLSVAGAGLTASLVKNSLGRARPKLFDKVGSFEFEWFAFTADYASFPSGHATSICAFAAALGLIWPRLRVPLFILAGWIAATRFLIGAHYFSDAVGGALLGASFPYFVRDRLADRRWLFVRAGEGDIRLRTPRILAWTLRGLRAGLLQRAGGNSAPADAESRPGTP